MAKIVCVGLACLDYLFKVENLPAGGGKSFASQYAAAPGGPAAAASIAVAGLGHHATFLGRFGDDQVARDILAQLAQRGVDGSRCRLIEGKSSQVSSVIVDSEGERQIVNFSSADLDGDPAWLPREVIEDADFILADVRWPEGAAQALTIARECGIPSLLDADIAPIDIAPLVDLARYVVFSEKGLANVSGSTDFEGGLQKVTERGTCWPAVTAGERGSFWLENDTLCSCPAEKITAIDTCGAGDVFHGAFAVAMAENMGMSAAMRFAGVTAAVKCLTFGGSLGAPQRDQVEQLLMR